MRYYRVLPLTNKTYVLQVRKWGFWFNLTVYDDRQQALDHLGTLNNGVLYRLERYIDINDEDPVPRGAGLALAFALVMELIARRVER